MEKMQHFVKNNLEENVYYNYFPEHGGSGRINDSEMVTAQRSDFNVLPHCPTSERIGFKTNNRNFQQIAHNSNTETFGSKNHSKKEPGSFKSYESFSNNYRKPNFVSDKGFPPKTTEYNYQNNNLNENGMRNETVRVFGNNDSDNLNDTRNYEGFSMNYRNEDQLRNNTLFPLNRGEFRNDKSFENSANDVRICNDSQNIDFFRNDTLQRNEQQFGGHMGTFGPYDPSRNNSIPGNPHEFNNNFGPLDSLYRNYECISNDIINMNEHQFQTNTLPNNRQQQRIGNVGPSDDQSNNYEWKFRRNFRDEQHLQRLDDGFQCVINPEFFPLLCRDNEHVSRDIGNKEENISNAISRKILPRGIRRNRSSSRGRSEEHKYRNGNRHERFRRKSRDDHHIKSYDSHRNKYSKVNTTHESNNNRKYPDKKDERLINSRSASYKKNRNNNHTDDDLSLPFRHSSTKRSSNRIDSKGISDLQSHGKERYTSNVSRNNDFSSSSQYSRKTAKPRSDVRNSRTATYIQEKKADKIFKKKTVLQKSKKKKINPVIKESKSTTKILARAQELIESGILKPTPKGHIKSEPEKYWKEWWSKFAYIERVIEKVDADEKSVKQFLKFHYDLNKTNLDHKVCAVFTVGLDKMNQAANISEINYERRTDAYKTLKYKKLLEDKDFQTFLLPREEKTLTKTLQNLKNNKNMLALLYQSIIYRWHISTRLTKSEERGSVDEVKRAGTILNDKLFQYLVYDSIRELKKLTTKDWPGFDEFYNNLQ